MTIGKICPFCKQTEGNPNCMFCKDKTQAPTSPSASPAPAEPAGIHRKEKTKAFEEQGQTRARDQDGLDYEFLYPGPFTMLKVRLGAGEMIKAESDAMVAMSTTIDVEGKLEGGVLGGLGRMLAGEKFFFQTLVARRGPGEVLLAHAIPGDITAIAMDGSRPYILQKDGFFAGSGPLDISTTMQNLTKGLFSGEGFFVIQVRGTGTLFVSSYGAVHPIDIPPGGEVIIDNSHLVAWPASMNYKIEKASSGWVSSITSGEALVCRFQGPGQVLIQTRAPRGFGKWIRQYISPARRR